LADPTRTPTTDWVKRLGALAVYPGHGVVRVDSLRTQEIGGNPVEFLVLRLIEDDSRILVPVGNTARLGLREVIDRTEASQIRKILRARTRTPPRGGGPWSRRFRDYQEKLRRGSIFEMAEVLSDLLRLQLEKELSFGEQRMLDSAWTRIVYELAAAESLPPEEVGTELRALLRRPRHTEGARAS
jgi:CarD family transcriptional regulator